MTRPRRRLWSARSWVWLCIAVLVALRVMTLSRAAGERDFSVSPLHEGACEVRRVLNGDTLLVFQGAEQGEVMLRLLSTQSIPAEEDAALAAQAKAFTERLVARGDVTLRLDNHRLDAHGRYLAYVDCAGESLNEHLIAAGLARFYYFPGNSPSTDRRLKDAEAAAQVAKVGIWSK